MLRVWAFVIPRSSPSPSPAPGAAPGTDTVSCFHLCAPVWLERSLGAGRRREVVHVSRAGGRRMRWGMSPGAPKFGLHAAPRRRRARTLGKRTLDSRNFAAVPSSRFGAPRRWRGRGAWSSFQERVRHRARPGRAFCCPSHSPLCQ